MNDYKGFKEFPKPRMDNKQMPQGIW